jgi:hypothetical protein
MLPLSGYYLRLDFVFEGDVSIKDITRSVITAMKNGNNVRIITPAHEIEK